MIIRSYKISLLLAIFLSLSCAKSGSTGGSGNLAVVTGQNLLGADGILCPVPGETPLKDSVFSTLYTGQCGCPSNTNGASCGAGNYCALSLLNSSQACLPLPPGASQLTSSCPIPGEVLASVLSVSGCACIVGDVPVSCSAGQICTKTGCAVAPVAPGVRRVFVTSRFFTPGTAYNEISSYNTFASVADADQACSDIGQFVAGSNTHWRAWIQAANSDPLVTAQSRLISAGYISGTDYRNVVLMDGSTKVSGPVSALSFPGTFDSGAHLSVITDEYNHTSTASLVWTGTNNKSCGTWNSNSGSSAAGVGNPASLTEWYTIGLFDQWWCSASFPIYCIESDS